jgi:hypothetical protein
MLRIYTPLRSSYLGLFWGLSTNTWRENCMYVHLRVLQPEYTKRSRNKTFSAYYSFYIITNYGLGGGGQTDSA